MKKYRQGKMIDFKIFFSYKDATSFFGIIEGRKKRGNINDF